LIRAQRVADRGGELGGGLRRRHELLLAAVEPGQERDRPVRLARERQLIEHRELHATAST